MVKSTRGVKMIAAAILLVAAGGATGVYLQHHGDATAIEKDVSTVEADADADADDLVRQPNPLYYTFTSPFTVNVKEGDAVIQATVAIETHYATTVENAKSDEPALRAQVIDVLSGTTEAIAATDAGKQQLEQQLAAALNRQIKQDGYGANIDTAYFSDFVIQGNNDDG